MGNKCALCGNRESHIYIASKRTRGKSVCIECLNELDTQKDKMYEGIAELKDKFQILANAARKGADAFKEEFKRQM